jgi:hypothetical protein
MEIATGIAPLFPYFPVIGGLFDLLVRMDLARRKGHRRCSAWLRWISFQAQAEGLIEMRNAIVVGAVSILSGLLLSGCVTPTNADKTVEMRERQAMRKLRVGFRIPRSSDIPTEGFRAVSAGIAASACRRALSTARVSRRAPKGIAISREPSPSS